MAIHVSAGHHTGTLVNALLYHCGLPAVTSSDPPDEVAVLLGSASVAGDGNNSLVSVDSSSVESSSDSIGSSRDDSSGSVVSGSSREYSLDGLRHLVAGGSDRKGVGEQDGSDLEGGDDGDEEEINLANDAIIGQAGSGDSSSSSTRSGIDNFSVSSGSTGVLRPGIVHRLDIGTSGLVVVAKREAAQRHLAAQFKARTVGAVLCDLSHCMHSFHACIGLLKRKPVRASQFNSQVTCTFFIVHKHRSVVSTHPSR